MRSHRFAQLVFVSFFLTVGAALWAWNFWRSGQLETHIRALIQKQIIQYYTKKIAPTLPFKIQSLEINATWENFLSGKIPHFVTRVTWNETSIRIEGELSVDWKKRSDRLHWHANIRSLVQHPKFQNQSQAQLSVETQKSQWTPQQAQIHIQSLEEVRIPSVSLQFAPPRLDAYWNIQHPVIEANVQTQQGEWKPSPTQTLLGQNLTLQLQIPFSPDPRWQLGGPLNAEIRLHSLEALWDDFYLDFPIQNQVISISSPWKIFGDSSTSIPHEIRAQTKNINARWTPGQIAISVLPTPISTLTTLFGQSPPVSTILHSIQLREGTWDASVQWPLNGQVIPNGTLRIRGARANDLQKKWGIKSVQINLRHDGPQWGLEADIPEFHLMNLQGSLRSLRLTASKDHGFWSVRSESQSQDSSIPLQLKDIPLSWGEIEGEWESPRQFSFQTRLHLPPTPLKNLLTPFCIPHSQIPPALIHAAWDEIWITEKMLAPQGQLEILGFDGWLALDSITLFRIFSTVPEIQFSAQWDQMRLDQISRWLHFGEMNGILRGHYLDGVFQSWLPTQYDFEIQALPADEKKIIFSPEAMKNVVRVFAGTDVDDIPSIAQWAAFGAPSKILGGYDVSYAGFRVHSREGSIQLETLDPPEFQRHHGGHFLIHGPRFKMPLQSTRYPLHVDASAMNTFVRRIIKQLKLIADAKIETRQKSTHTPPGTLEFVPEASCFPEGFYENEPL